jgi:hypothetical protein
LAKAKVCAAIIPSSLVGMRKHKTLEYSVEMMVSPEVFLAGSNSMPNHSQPSKTS